MAAARRIAIVVGSHGALGRAVVARFKLQGWDAVGVDVQRNPECVFSVDADLSLTWPSRQDATVETLRARFPGRFAHAVVCTAGGWTGGGVGDAGLAASTDAMLRVCLQPAIDAARLAGDFLEPQGTVVLTGAAAALGPTPGMLGYGMAKAATHHLVRSLAAAPEPGPSGSGLPASTLVLGVLPGVLDTPANRAAMGGPGADLSGWTPVATVAEVIEFWCTQHARRRGMAVGGGAEASDPPSGALLRVNTEAGQSSWTLC